MKEYFDKNIQFMPDSLLMERILLQELSYITQTPNEAGPITTNVRLFSRNKIY